MSQVNQTKSNQPINIYQAGQATNSNQPINSINETIKLFNKSIIQSKHSNHIGQSINKSTKWTKQSIDQINNSNNPNNRSTNQAINQ